MRACTAIGANMRARYEKFGILDILPAHPLDVLHDQLIPGRARMLENFAALERHPGSVAAIDGDTVVLADGKKLEGTDVLLWGTGYSTDLSYIAVPRIAAVRNVSVSVRRSHLDEVRRARVSPPSLAPMRQQLPMRLVRPLEGNR